MCLGCTEKITTGERHLSEYIVEQRERPAKEWKTISVDAEGVEASILLPLTPVCGLIGPNNPSYRAYKVSEFTHDEMARLIEIYHSEPLHLERLFSLRHPLRKEVPYFRQVLPIKGGILIGNAFGFPRAGTVKLLGSPEKLAGIVQMMLETQFKPGRDWQSEARFFIYHSKFWLDDAQVMEKLVSIGGIVKVMGNYAFVVAEANLNGSSPRECFCATDNPRMVAEAVMMKLKE